MPTTTKSRIKSSNKGTTVNVDMSNLLHQVDTLEKGSPELRKLRNVIWKKIAEQDLPDEAVNEMRAVCEKHGYEISKRTWAKLKKEYRPKTKTEKEEVI